jgi:hypothetical protein
MDLTVVLEEEEVVAMVACAKETGVCSYLECISDERCE